MELVKSLLQYPLLERVFDPADAQNFPALKQKMQSTIDDLERVVRRGTKTDAEKAARVLESYKLVSNFLDEMDKTRRTQSNQ